MGDISSTCTIEDPVGRPGLAAQAMPGHGRGHCRSRWATPTVGREWGNCASPWRRTEVIIASREVEAPVLPRFQPTALDAGLISLVGVCRATLPVQAPSHLLAIEAASFRVHCLSRFKIEGAPSAGPVKPRRPSQNRRYSGSHFNGQVGRYLAQRRASSTSQF